MTLAYCLCPGAWITVITDRNTCNAEMIRLRAKQCYLGAMDTSNK